MASITNDEFERAVSDALDSVPERFKQALSNIAISVQDEPSARDLQSAHVTNGELLGLYQGIPLPQRTTSYSGVLPDIITIYRGPHERVCHTYQDLVTQIRITVLHELGHYFGFDDQYLHSHGY